MHCIRELSTNNIFFLANALSQSGMNKPQAEGNVNHNLDLDLEKYFVVNLSGP